MKILFVITNSFLHWPIEISKEIVNRKIPNSSFCSLVIAPLSTYTKIKQQTNPTISPSHLINELEKKWLKTPYNIERLQHYENLLGNNIINELIISDRYLGNEYVLGGVTYHTPLTDYTRSRDKQLSYINGLLDFLFDFLQKEKPDLVLAPAAASALTLAIAKVAQALKIKFRNLNPSRFESYYILDSSPYFAAPSLKEAFNNALKRPEILGETLKIAKGKFAHFQNNLKPPSYWKHNYNRAKKPPTLLNTLSLIYRTIIRRPPEMLAHPYPWSRLFYDWRRYFIYVYYPLKKTIFSDYSSIKDHKYIYYPLHHDPEATTTIFAPNYTNQLDLIERLSKNIPTDTILAVKEHIPMLGNRPKNFYKKIKSFTNVKLISPFVSSTQMIKGSILTVTITGTAGFEALMLQKPLLCFAKANYHAINNGFTYCDNLNELSNKIRTAITQNPASNHELEIYLACVIKEGFECKPEFLTPGVNNELAKRSQKFVCDLADKLIKVVSNETI